MMSHQLEISVIACLKKFLLVRRSSGDDSASAGIIPSDSTADKGM
jgi:hypothetical protein